MATVNTTTATINAVLLARGSVGISSEQPEPPGGNADTEKQIVIPGNELTGASITPKLDDFIVDADSNTWLVTGISIDPMNAAWTLQVRKV